MEDFLFDEFDEVSAKAWKQKIQADLKGADYNETLLWQSNEGITVKPFYHADDSTEHHSPAPGQPAGWSICQGIFIDNESIANKLATDALKRGAETIHFTAEKEFLPEEAFKNIQVGVLYVELHFLSEGFLNKLKTYFSSKKTTVYIHTDIIGNLARSGNWFHNSKEDFKILDTAFAETSPNINLLGADLTLYQNAGATMVQQLAYGMAHAYEYLNHLANSGSSVLKDKPFIFKVAVGSNYFFEIAKLRALRRLYAALAASFGFYPSCHILAVPSKRNKTIYDYNVNMLRTTTECMSAILGGANAVCNIPYDAVYHKSNEFAERIARNQLLILRKESYFEAVSNPADGAYYIEDITTRLSDKALALFKEIESSGGFLKQLHDGTIQKKVKESAAREQQQVENGERVLLGVNKHPNKNERMKDDLELYPFTKTNIRKTLIEPIFEKRLAENIELERIKGESHSE